MVPTVSYLNNLGINPTGNEIPRGGGIQGVGVGAEKRTQLLASRNVEVSSPGAHRRASSISADGSVSMITPEKPSNAPNFEPISKSSPHATNASLSLCTFTNVNSVIAPAQTPAQTLTCTSIPTEGSTKLQTEAPVNNGSDQNPSQKVKQSCHLIVRERLISDDDQIQTQDHQRTPKADKNQNQVQIQNGEFSNSASSSSPSLTPINAGTITTPFQSTEMRPSLSNVSSLSDSFSAFKNVPMHHNSPSCNRVSGAAAEPSASGVGSETNSNSSSTLNREKVISITSTKVNADANVQGSKMSLQPNPHLETTWAPRGRRTELESLSQDTGQLQLQPQSQAQSPLQFQNKRKREETGEGKRLELDSPSRKPSAPQPSASSIVSPRLLLANTKATNEPRPTSKMDVRGNPNSRSTPSDMEIDSDDMMLQQPLDTIQTQDTGTAKVTEPNGAKPSSDSITNRITDTSRLLSQDVISVSPSASKSQRLELDTEPSNAQTLDNTYQSPKFTASASQNYPETTLHTVTNTAPPYPRNDPALGRRIDDALRDLVSHTAIDSKLVLRLAKELQETKKKLSEVEAKKNETTSMQGSEQEVGVPSDRNTISNSGLTGSVLAAQLQQKDEENNELRQRLSNLEQHYRSAVEMNQRFEIEMTALRSALSGKEKDLQTFAERCQRLEADIYRTQQEKSNLVNHCRVLQNRLLHSELNRSASHGTLTGINTPPSQSPMNSPTSASGSSGIPAIHQHGPISRTMPSHPAHFETIGATSTTPAQSPRQENFVPPPAGAGPAIPVTSPFVRAGSTGATPAQSRMGSPVVPVSPGHAVGQQGPRRNPGAPELQSQRQKMEIAREQYIPVPQRRSSMPLQQHQQQQQYSASQHQTHFMNQRLTVQERVIIHHGHIQTQQLHNHTSSHNWASQIVNAFSQLGGGHVQIQRDHPPLSASRRHSHPPVVNSAPSQHTYVQNVTPARHVQSFVQNGEQHHQNRHTSSPLSTPSTSSVPLTAPSQRVTSSGSVTATRPSPSFPQNIGQTPSMPVHMGRQSEHAIMQGQDPVVTAAFGLQPMPQPQGQVRPQNPHSLQGNRFVSRSPSQPLDPSQGVRTHANSVSSHPIPHPPGHSSQVPYSYVMAPNQTVVQCNTPQETWSHHSPTPQITEARQLPRSHQPPMQVKRLHQTTAVDSPLPAPPKAANATVIDLTLDETEAEEMEPPKKRQKVEETKQIEGQEVVSAPVSVVHSLGEKAVDSGKVEGDPPATTIDEVDISAASTTAVVATVTGPNAALPPSSQPLVINGVDISRPEIMETLTQAYEIPPDDPSSRCCLFCRLRHEDDPEEWPQITRLKDPTIEETVNHLIEIHTSVWQTIISGNFEDDEQE